MLRSVIECVYFPLGQKLIELFGKVTVSLSLSLTKTIPNQYFDKWDRFVGIVIMLRPKFKLIIKKGIAHNSKQQNILNVVGWLIL